MKNEWKQLNQYVKQFDLKEKEYMDKFHHAYRVMEYAKQIAESLKLNEEDMKLVTLIALFHDIGRFKQWKMYHTYNDFESVDHADFGVQIIKENDLLKQFVKSKENYQLLLKGIKNHNKRKEPLNERELLFTSIVRDADKLDILIEQSNQIRTENPVLNSKFVASILNQELCQDENIKQKDEDDLLRSLAFIFDIQFDYTLNYLKEKRIIENKFNLLDLYFANNTDVEKIKKTISDYLEKREKTC